MIYPIGGYGIEHGRYLQWGNGQPALPEGKACQTACILQVCRAGQLPRRALQPRHQQSRVAKAKALRGIQNCLPAQQLAQRNKVTVTALFQRAAQVDSAVRPPQRTAEGFPRRLDTAGAVIGEPVQPLGIGCRSQHHLEHRTRAESGQTAVNEGGIIGADAGGDIIGVKFRHTGAGQNLPAAHLHDDDAAFAHILGGNRFAGTLDVGIQREGNGCVGTAGGGLHLRRGARQQIPAGSGGAKHGLGVPRRGQKIIIGLFQPGHTVAVPIQVADQVTGDGGWQIAPGIRHHEHAVCGQIIFHFNQKRGDAVTAGIQLGLLGKRHKGKQCGIAGIPRYAERVPPRSNAG